MSHRAALQHRLLGIGALVVLAGLVVASDTLHDRMSDLVVYTQALIGRAPVLGMAAFVLLALLSAMVAFFSSAVLAPIAIAAWGETTTFACLWAGWWLGGAASYGIGRYFGTSVAAAMLGADKFAGWRTEIGRRARFHHVLLFQAILPSEIPGYVLGTLRYPAARYLGALAVTELPYAAATVYLGASFLRGDSVAFLVAGAVILSFAVLVLRLRRLAERRRAPWRAQPSPTDGPGQAT